MSFSDGEIRRQLRLGEDSRWEFKEIRFAGNIPKSPSRDDLADEIAAFANTEGGVLLCGVTDAGDVVGMSRGQMDELERLLVEVCTDEVKPPIRPVFLRMELDEGLPFLLVEVPQGHAQHDSPGGSFHRVGSSKRRMTSDERLRLAQRRGQARFLWFDKQPVSGTGVGSLDESLWKPLLSVEGAVDPESALDKMGLLATDEYGTTRATVAGVLLCTRSPEEWLPNSCIVATFYRGKERGSGQIDAQTITGPLNRQIAEAVAFALRNMRVGAYKNPARTDLPQYSEQALFEAIVNAVVHRDYSIQGSKIRLSMFADRVEINSPGGLTNNLTVDSMADRQSTRNEGLASVLGRIPVSGIRGAGNRQFFMERRGDGVPIINRETKALTGQSPVYRVIDGSDLFLTIPAAATDSTRITATILCRFNGIPMPGVELLAIFRNRVWTHVDTKNNGEAQFNLPFTYLPITVFAAASGFVAHIVQSWVPAEGALTIEMRRLPEGGSVILPKGTGSLPGLKGRLNLGRAANNQSYLYASDTAINEGQLQPVFFIPGEELHLTDDVGSERVVRIVGFVGRSALVEYRRHLKEDPA